MYLPGYKAGMGYNVYIPGYKAEGGYMCVYLSEVLKQKMFQDSVPNNMAPGTAHSTITRLENCKTQTHRAIM